MNVGHFIWSLYPRRVLFYCMYFGSTPHIFQPAQSARMADITKFTQPDDSSADSTVAKPLLL